MKNNILVLICVICFTSVNAQDKNVEIGYASFYADKFVGRTTANGEKYFHEKNTAAHQKLSFGTIVKVTNLENGKVVVVRINDRGPFVDNRVIDLSLSAARELDFVNKGIVKVKLEILGSLNDHTETAQSTEKEVTSEYYTVDVTRIRKSGFGIQIGSFEEYENVLRLVERLKNKYNQSVVIEVAQKGKITLYRVIIGIFNEKSEAENILKATRKEYPESFVVTYK